MFDQGHAPILFLAKIVPTLRVAVNALPAPFGPPLVHTMRGMTLYHSLRRVDLHDTSTERRRTFKWCRTALDWRQKYDLERWSETCTSCLQQPSHVLIIFCRPPFFSPPTRAAVIVSVCRCSFPEQPFSLHQPPGPSLCSRIVHDEAHNRWTESGNVHASTKSMPPKRTARLVVSAPPKYVTVWVGKARSSGEPPTSRETSGYSI